jgi:hypothetical protein
MTLENTPREAGHETNASELIPLPERANQAEAPALPESRPEEAREQPPTTTRLEAIEQARASVAGQFESPPPTRDPAVMPTLATSAHEATAPLAAKRPSWIRRVGRWIDRNVVQVDAGLFAEPPDVSHEKLGGKIMQYMVWLSGSFLDTTIPPSNKRRKKK